MPTAGTIYLKLFSLVEYLKCTLLKYVFKNGGHRLHIRIFLARGEHTPRGVFFYFSHVLCIYGIEKV